MIIVTKARATALGAVAVVAAALVAAPAVAATKLVDVSKRAGIFDIAHTWSAEPGKVNKDRWEDLLVINHYQPVEEGTAYLYLNDGDGTFTRTNPGFPKADRHDCAIADVDRNGRSDIFCTVGGERGFGAKPKELWMQRRDGTFVNRASEYGIEDRKGRGRDTVFIDVNHDRFIDLYVANKVGRGDGKKSKNKLFINGGGDRFQGGGKYGINRQVGGKTVQAIDYDRDGWEDLLVCGDDRLFLFRNVRGRRFDNVSARARVNVPCEGALMTRINGDGRPDLVTVTRTRLKVMHQAKNGRFGGKPAHKRKLRAGAEVAAGKVDRDSRPDLYVLRRGKPGKDPPDLMLLNRRGGERFEKLKIPQTRRGKGDYVTSFDYDRNGRDDFVVLNGYHKHPGPVRLLAAKG